MVTVKQEIFAYPYIVWEHVYMCLCIVYACLYVDEGLTVVSFCGLNFQQIVSSGIW